MAETRTEKQADRTTREVLTLLDETQRETTIVQLVDNKDSKVHPLTDHTSNVLAMCADIVQTISTDSYSIIGVKKSNAVNFGSAIPCGQGLHRFVQFTTNSPHLGVWLVLRHVMHGCEYARIPIPPKDTVDFAQFTNAAPLKLTHNFISNDDYKYLNALQNKISSLFFMLLACKKNSQV